MRGEHHAAPGQARRPLGSSPHARGALEAGAAIEDVAGIIPACAGSTRRAASGGRTSGDHPRTRGEHRLDTRGCQGTVGIIPACAGSTSSRCYSQMSARDHPRMRGEHTDTDYWIPVASGSSPHARGALFEQTHHVSRAGIIPACAGSTRRQGHARRAPRDHPRMRGEHDVRIVAQVLDLGSSPHARGARRVRGGCGPPVGIIPACAGSTDE